MMRIPDCPKKLRDCPMQHCPMYPCWAYEKHLDNKDRQKRDADSGWE